MYDFVDGVVHKGLFVNASLSYLRAAMAAGTVAGYAQIRKNRAGRLIDELPPAA